MSKKRDVKLTKGERLYIVRRRRGMSQEDFAARFGVSHDTLSKVEKGRKLPPHAITVYGRVAPTKGEQITILRRRLGLTIAELALHLDLSKVTMMARERGIGDVDYVLGFLKQWVKRKQSPLTAYFEERRDRGN